MNSFLRTVLNSDGTEDWSEDKMKKLRLVDLLLMVADKKLKNGQKVLINDDCYSFDKKEEKFVSKKGYYRMIYTYEMNLTCYILEDYEEKGK